MGAAREPVARNELGQELVKTLREINHQIEIIKEAAQMRNITVYDLVDHNGYHVYIPLICAKAQVVHALTIFNDRT